MHVKEGLFASRGLSEMQLEQILSLASACELHDKFDLTTNLNVSMLKNRSNDQHNDFLYFRGGQLVGYLGMYSMVNPAEVEIFGMVHPAYRRQGLFSALYEEAKREYSQRSVTQILLVCNQQSESAKGFLLHGGAAYSFSEYKLDYISAVDSFKQPKAPFVLRMANQEDFNDLVDIGVSGFGDAPEEMHELVKRNLLEPEHQTYVAVWDGEPVGMITASRDDEAVFVTGFCVKEELQGKGIGRSMLSQLIDIVKKAGTERISIEVETENINALKLYQSVGFVMDAGYDYYLA